MKPTKEQIAEARSRIQYWTHPSRAHLLDEQFRPQIELLLAATEPHPTQPRPADMAEFARLVAKELRRRGIWASHCDESAPFGASVGMPRFFAPEKQSRRFWYSLHGVDFDNLTPSEIADLIQAEEAKRAKEWAGDT